MHKALRTIAKMIAVAALVAAGGYAWQRQLAFWRLEAARQASYIAELHKNDGFYRVITHLTYDGAPLDVDLVVSCLSQTIRYRDNDKTVETLGLWPYRYLFKLPGVGNHALEVRVNSHTCSNDTTESGMLSRYVLPWVIWV